MKPIFFTILFSISVFSFSRAQNPLVKMWDYRFGGDTLDYLLCFQPTRDGGYILGGISYSNISGDKTQNSLGLGDFWIIKTNSNGNKQWDKDFGGTERDILYSIKQTTDGGYILGGTSFSNISGNKTQNSWGQNDYWIIKIDSLGNYMWDKDYGGNDNESLWSLYQTKDKGYIIGGWSNSNISGDKTQNTQGSNDYWIIKIDSLGNKQWDKDYGGINLDYLYSIQQTHDGGYILGGTSQSNISGDKSENLWGGIFCDYWIVKLDSLGNKIWDKDFGGTSNDNLLVVEETSDKGFVLGGYSASSIGGSKTQNLWGIVDYWIVKIDSIGNKQWDKDFGGTEMEEFKSLCQTKDGGFLISGHSDSPISGDKTESNLGQSQIWILKIDSLGNKKWDKTIATVGNDMRGISIESMDGCYTTADFTNSGIGGDKTQNNRDTSLVTYDYWIIKFCDSTMMIPLSSTTANSNLCPGTCTNFLNLSLYATGYFWSFPGAIPNYSIDNNPSNICYSNPGSYDVTLIASNANGSDTLTLQNYITVFQQPPAQSISQSNDTLFAIDGSSSYQWYFNGNIISGATDYFYVAQSSGDYNVVATDTNGCEVEAVINNVIARLTPALSKGEGVVFPNPVLETLTVIAPGLNVTADEISVYNVLGEKVMEVSPLSFGEGLGGEAMWIVDCRPLPPGLYYLELRADDKTFRSKFLKQ